MLIHFRDEVILSKRTEASRNKGLQIEPAPQGKEHTYKTCIFRKLAFKYCQDCQSTNNAISIYVKQTLYLSVHLENTGKIYTLLEPTNPVQVSAQHQRWNRPALFDVIQQVTTRYTSTL